jgi:hypothetical protein
MGRFNDPTGIGVGVFFRDRRRQGTMAVIRHWFDHDRRRHNPAFNGWRFKTSRVNPRAHDPCRPRRSRACRKQIKPKVEVSTGAGGPLPLRNSVKQPLYIHRILRTDTNMNISV